VLPRRMGYARTAVVLAAARDVDRPTAPRPGGKTFSSHGRHHGLRTGWLTFLHAYFSSGAGLLLVQKTCTGKTKPHLRMDPRRLFQPTRVVPQSSQEHTARGRSHFWGYSSSPSVHRRRV